MSSVLPSDKELQNLRVLNVLYGSMLFGLICFAVVAYVLGKSFDILIDIGFSNTQLLYFIAILSAVLLFISGTIYRRKIEGIRTSYNTWNERFGQFRKVLLITIALIEIAAFMSILGFLFTGNAVFLGMLFIILAYAFTKAPWIERNKEEAGLNIY